jgi:type II secretory pathway pseudopilin PulG
MNDVMDAAKRLLPVTNRCVSLRIRSGRRKTSKKCGYSLLELLVILAILLMIAGIGTWKLSHAFQEVSRWLALAGQTVVR